MLPVVATFAWAWNSKPLRLRDLVYPRRLAEVYPGFLYRSGQISPSLIEGTLRDLGIDVIVDLTGPRGDEAQRREREVAAELGLAYHNFTLNGSGTGEIDEYVGALEVIARAEAAGLQVLVHCRAGDRRTGGVVAAYQTLVRGEPWSRALDEIERFNRKPLERSRLLPYLHQNLPTMQARLVDRGVRTDASGYVSGEGGVDSLSRSMIGGSRVAN
jgi:protein tyrosine/serine phosphatase